MLPREDFIFTIGYDGPTAVIDKQAKRKYGKLSTRELAEKGLFRPAYSSAVFSGDKEEMIFVEETYKRLGVETGLSENDLSAMDRLFGVSLVDVNKYIAL